MSVKTEKDTGRLWVRLIRGHRAAREIIVPCAGNDPLPALREAARALDLEVPIWLPRHQADWTAFKLTRFTADHFIQPVDFDRMEISYIAPEGERKRPRSIEP